ncbi:MAG TPA: hypothetical protein VMH23_13210 [Bacteroidota bacterium]|nr:hypothetical protein [Bacteroidota bacterium]
MIPSEETLKLLDEIERSSDRTLNYRDDVGILIDTAVGHRKLETFHEAIFLAKFIVKSMGVMKRIGNDGEGFNKFAAELESNIQKVSGLLRLLVDLAPEEARRSIAPFFFTLTPEGFDHLMLLMVDLTTVKNWVLDGHSLPGESPAL